MIKQDGFILIWMEDLNIQNKIVGNEHFIIENLNLRINSGEYVCISGLYGTDKISFINTISCLNRPDHGKYLYNYNDTATIDQSKLDGLRSEIGFLFKNLNLMNDLTVYQNIEIPILISSIVEKSKKVEKAADQLGLSDLLYKKVEKLSELEKHKVSLARALVVSPILIIADEPADNLKYEEAEIIFNIMKEINNQGTAILCFSDKTQVIEKAQRTIMFEKGSVKYDRRPQSCCVEEGVV
ncbi:MAG: transporter ATP-binding protein [Clostridia bacterium]|jgi:putative ABC transport system ATP-binding protein|nr:transporter ATP-binding protein [Clostridia bacterium]